MSQAAPEFDDLSDLEFQRRFFARRSIAAARIPSRFANKTLENFDADGKARAGLIQSARRYIAQFDGASDEQRGLLFSATTPGAGKSHLAAAILKELVAGGRTGLFWNAPDLLMELRSTIEDPDRTEQEIIDEVVGVNVLVLDDLGAEKATDFVLDRFYLIVNRRYEAMRPTIVTSNLSVDGIQARLGERIASRLCEMCKVVTAFPAEDYRRRMLKEVGR